MVLMPLLSRLLTLLVILTMPLFLARLTLIPIKSLRSEERFSRNAETELVCRLLLEKKNAAVPPRGPRPAGRRADHRPACRRGRPARTRRSRDATASRVRRARSDRRRRPRAPLSRILLRLTPRSARSALFPYTTLFRSPLLSRLLTLLVILTMPLFLARLTLIPIKSLSICFRVICISITTILKRRGCLTVPRLTLMSLIKMMLVMVSVAAISKTFGLLRFLLRLSFLAK